MSAPLITLRDMSILLGANRVLQDVNLSITPGEIVTVVGPNGSGKSALVGSGVWHLPFA